jgi:succinoglycan biosynthesis protein ExoA
MVISIIVPCRNENTHICRFLDSVMSQQLEPNWQLEVLIADGQSDDGTRETLEGYARRLSTIRVIDNPGRIVSTGLNAAIAAAAGDVIMRMDAHTTYAKDYILECVRVLETSGADNVGGPWIAEGRGLWGNAIAAAFRSPFCCGGGRAHDPGYEGEVDTVYLGCWPRSVFNKVGLFDPSLVRNQDDEFNFRLRNCGGKLWQSPRIRSSYVARSSMRALFRQYLQYGFWKVAVIRKHGEPASWRHVIPALFVSSLILIPLFITIAVLLGMQNAAIALAALLFAELTVYAGASVVAACSCVNSLNLRTLSLLPAVFAVYHLAYGLGFLMGIFVPAGREGGVGGRNALFTSLTR